MLLNCVYAVGEGWQDFEGFKLRIMNVLDKGYSSKYDMLFVNRFRNYLESEGYKVKDSGEDVYFGSEPLYAQYALRICEYVERNIGMDPSNPLSVVLYAAILDRPLEEVRAMFASAES